MGRTTFDSFDTDNVNVRSLTLPVPPFNEKCSLATADGSILLPATTPAADFLEELAKGTWETLAASLELRVSQSEETITDNNLLAIKRRGIREIRLWKCPKNQESRKGIDWEWFIGSNRRGWLRYAVQAKKINLEKGTYKSLDHMVKGTGKRQIRILEAYASRHRAIPIYCYYNYVGIGRRLDSYWQCGLPFEKEQFGCTVASLRCIKEALHKSGRRSNRNFRFIHSNSGTIPWRCLVRCPNLLKMYRKNPPKSHPLLGDFRLYEEIPREVSSLFEDYPHVAYPNEYKVIPARVMLIELTQDSFEAEHFTEKVPPLP